MLFRKKSSGGNKRTFSPGTQPRKLEFLQRCSGSPLNAHPHEPITCALKKVGLSHFAERELLKESFPDRSGQVPEARSGQAVKRMKFSANISNLHKAQDRNKSTRIFQMQISRFLLSLLLILALTGFTPTSEITLNRGENLSQLSSLLKKLEKKGSLVNGDVIFQTSLSSQSKAIQLATNSVYSHCGILNWEAGQCYVWEAGNGVRKTPIKEFIKRGKGGHFVIKRLKNTRQVFHSVEVLEKFTRIFHKEFLNKPYDPFFEWSDDKIYCSELIWKLYKKATGLELGKIQKLRDFNLKNETVRKKLEERYGKNIPLDEKVISPASIFESELLKTIESI